MKTLFSKFGWLSIALLINLFTSAQSWAEYEEIIYYHNDALGSPVMASDATGNVKWEEDYMPFGKRLEYQSQELVNGEPQEDAWDETVWYTGKQEETRLGLVYMGARWYDPSIGRFMAMDPAGVREHIASNPMMFNRYTYANNNPYRYIDPHGQSPDDIYESELKDLRRARAGVTTPVKAVANAAADVSQAVDSQLPHDASDFALSVLAGGVLKKLGSTVSALAKRSGMLGANGTKTASKTLWKGKGKERIDVENPNPGKRPGQIHYQDNKNNKYLYDPETNSFPDAPNSVNKLLDDKKFKAAIDKAMTKYLGE